jgi:prephenate dehydrogenase
MTLAQLTVVGAGLIGGSIALAAKKAGVVSRICAIDRGVESSQPDGNSPFDEWVDGSDASAVARVMQASSLTILCVPVISIIDLLPGVLSQSGGPITDCGSTKKAIIDSVRSHANRGKFVAGHPMAGHPEGGLKNARADLFCDKKWILCPQDSAPEAVLLVRDFVVSLGARPVELPAEAHDRSVAITSHLPQVLASALAVIAERKDALNAAGPGFASATRVAGGAEDMWRDIFGTNAKEISEALIEIGQLLQKLGTDLKDDDIKSSIELLRSARRTRESTSD